MLVLRNVLQTIIDLFQLTHVNSRTVW